MRIRKQKIELAHGDWETLVREVMSLREEELEELLRMERERDSPRQQFLKRVHQRLTKLRSQRERSELLREARKKEVRGGSGLRGSDTDAAPR